MFVMLAVTVDDETLEALKRLESRGQDVSEKFVRDWLHGQINTAMHGIWHKLSTSNKL